jgi:hypothetical protein
MKKIIFLSLIITSIFLVGCSTIKKTNPEYSSSLVKPECEAEANSLYPTCTQGNLNNLNIESLAKCDRLMSDKTSFLSSCGGNDLYDFVSTDYSSSSTSETIFGKKLIDICDNTKFSDFTMNEINICEDFSNDFNILNCDCGQ